MTDRVSVSDDTLRLDPEPPSRGRGRRRLIVGVGVFLVLAILVALTFKLPVVSKYMATREAQSDAKTALAALNDGDLAALDKQLAANRGSRDFAYFFASDATPRALGDALATVAGEGKDAPLKDGVDPHAYDLVLMDLAGTLGLATHGGGDRVLPSSWTEDFIAATTYPKKLYGKDSSESEDSEKARIDQDEANKQNLLLLLARGYWSTGFLKAVTSAYWEFDRDKGEDAWPGSTLRDAKYAPAANGSYLTDGVLALTAALTANPTASEWAFTDFKPGVAEVDGSDYAVGKFTHFLMFEHRFPGASDGDSIGMTATLTALSAAVAGTETQAEVSAQVLSKLVGPKHDAEVLQTVARDAVESGCSWSPVDYGNCAVAAAEAVWQWIKHWGHLVLDLLSFTATFAPLPIAAIGVAAASVNATWYAIEGDYVMAGLALAAAVPGLAFTKLVKAAKAGASAAKDVKVVKEADDLAQVAQKFRAAVEVNEKGLAYPKVLDPRTGAPVYFPGTGLKKVPLSERVSWGGSEREAFIKEWLARGYKEPKGGWAGYDIHHIRPREYGGSNDFDNLVPLERKVDHQQYTAWWRDY